MMMDMVAIIAIITCDEKVDNAGATRIGQSETYI